MTARLHLTAKAEADLEAIGDVIARDEPASAARFIAQLRGAAQAIARTPLAFPARDAVSPGLRVRPFRRYLIYYRVDAEADAVRIVRILHAAMDPDADAFRDR